MKTIYKLAAFSLLMGPLFPSPAAAFTATASQNAYMVENTTGTSPSGAACYEFQTRPTCSAFVNGLILSTSTVFPAGSTNYIQNTANPTITTQVFNVSSGTAALFTSTNPVKESDANLNVGYGSGVMVLNPSGVDNTAMGINAGSVLTTGQNNTLFGSDALSASGAAIADTAIGSESMATASGSNSTAIGFQALHGATGNNNTGLGYQSLFGVSSGVSNVGVGTNSGNLPVALTTASSNTFIGANAGSSGQFNYAAAIGAEAQVTAANTIQMGGTGSAAATVNGSTLTFSSGTITQFNTGVITSTQGIILTNSAGYVIGSLVQYVSSCTVATVNRTSNAYSQLGSTVTFTPKSSSDIVEVCVNGSFEVSDLSRNYFHTIMRNGSTNLAIGANGFGEFGANSVLTGTDSSNLAYCIKDSPGTISSTNYSLYAKNDNNTATYSFPTNDATNTTACISVKEFAQ